MEFVMALESLRCTTQRGSYDTQTKSDGEKKEDNPKARRQFILKPTRAGTECAQICQFCCCSHNRLIFIVYYFDMISIAYYGSRK
jgi:hypothetical protein